MKVVRVWRGRGSPEGVQRYCSEHFVPVVLPELQAIDGFVSARVLTRDDGDGAEVVVETTWESFAAIAAFAGEDATRAVVEPVVAELLDSFDERVVHLTLHVGD